MPVLIEELLRKRNEIDAAIRKDYKQQVTVVFTDIVGSTEYFASKGDIAGRAMVQEHNDLLFPIIKEHHGRIIKTIGDAIMAGFDKAVDGVQAAIRMQERLAEYNQEAEDEIRIRIGLHTGQAITEPDDIFGDTVNTAAKVEGLADGDQILISGATSKEIEKERFNLHSHGNYSLKGLKEEMPVYEVLWSEGQQPKLPPQPTFQKIEHNLPQPSPVFVGRERDLRELRKRENRLLTITGGAGIGKTTIAVHLAWWYAEEGLFSRIFFVRLQDAKNVDHLFERLGHTLGIKRFEIDLSDIPEDRTKEEEFSQKTSRIITRLKISLGGKTLFLLDNFETIADERSISLLDSLLKETKDTWFIITSRRSIGLIAWEKVYHLPPLSPKKAQELFIKQSRKPILKEERQVVETICESVHRIPLAIELVAQHTREMTLKEIEEGLEKSRLSLQRADLSVAERFKDMAASLEFTYMRLKDNEKRLFLILSIFRGDFDRRAVKGISKMGDWSDLLASLINWHLLQHREERDLSRYLFLETIREYAGLKLKDEGVSLGLSFEELCFWHSQYYLKIARDSSDPWPEIEQDEANIRQAADWTAEGIEKGDRDREIIDLAHDYAFALNEYIYRRSIQEGLRWLEAGVIACQELGEEGNEATLYNSIGLRYDSQGNYQEALKWYEMSSKICEKIGDQAGLAATYNNIANIHYAQDKYREALKWHEKSIKIKEEIGDQAGLSTTYNNIGMVHDAQGNYQEALKWYKKSKEILEKIGSRHHLAMSLRNIGLLYRATGQEKEAATCLKESLQIYIQLNLPDEADEVKQLLEGL